MAHALLLGLFDETRVVRRHQAWRPALGQTEIRRWSSSRLFAPRGARFRLGLPLQYLLTEARMKRRAP